MKRLFLCLGLLGVGAFFLILAHGRALAAAPPLSINELLVGNTSTNIDTQFYNFEPWLELRNTSGATVNLANYTLRSLRDGTSTWEVYTIPSGITIPNGGNLLFWADTLATGVHTNFELDMDGGELALHNPGGAVVDSVTFGEQEPDVSYGRLPDGSGNWAYFDQPTPGGLNSTPAFATYNFAPAPSFSVAGGVYAAPQSVQLSTTEPDATIRYTLDGSKPTASSTAYSGPIAVTVPKVIRARTFASGKMVSPTVTHSYLIGVSTTLPIVSIATNPANLWDNTIGIYVKGNNGFRECGIVANWNQPWERPASIEFFETDGANKIRQEIGVEIHGRCSRSMQRKSLELKARKRYGDNDMDYAFFDDKSMNAYKRLLLRNSGQDGERAMLRDAMITTLFKDRLEVDFQAYRPAIVFLNGEYWGIHDLREKVDEDFVENNYDLDENTFDMVDKNNDILAGDLNTWREFADFLKANNAASPAVYAEIRQRMDVDRFMNYMIVLMYPSVVDWPDTNQRYWRERVPDGQWTWIPFDLDSSFRNARVNLNMFKYIPTRRGNTSMVIGHLVKNVQFRQEFAQRFAVHLNTTYQTSRVIGIINTLQAELAPEIPDHVARWGNPSSYEKWVGYVDSLDIFAQKRPAVMRDHLRRFVGNPPDSTLTINLNGVGRVFVAGAEVFNGYSGLHFRGVPITLSALPGPGTVFSHWQETGETNPVTSLPFTGNTTRTAVFEAVPLPPLVINEIHHTPGPALDDSTYEFVEIYNAGASAVALSGFSIPDALPFTFPAGATIAAGGFVVIADTPATYAAAGCPVYDFNGGLSGGEAVTLKNNLDFTVDTVTYASVAPWPNTPNAGGPSLSLLDPALDNSQAANWAASLANGGTPCAVNFPPPPPTPPVIINEIHYNPTGGTAFEFIELVNNGPTSVALDGYTFEGLVYTFPDGTNLPASGYLVLVADATNYPGATEWTSGDLADSGERIALVDTAAQVVDEVTYGVAAPWAIAPNGTGPSLSLGRVGLDNSLPASWGASQAAEGTPGADNFPPQPIVINELHHTPANPTVDDNTYEFLELYNAGPSTIDLSGYTLVGVTFAFPAGSSIAAGEYIVIADTPTTYSAGGFQVFDFSGGLSDAGEVVSVVDRFGNVNNSVTYGVVAPWPSTPNAGGPSLSLKSPTDDNSLPANWAASDVIGGTPGAVNTITP